MTLFHTYCALLAPALVRAAAFQWSLPEPTIHAPAVDNWSPAPTAAPQLPASWLFRRQTAENGYTCAFQSGSSESSITCSNTNFVCATNTQYGVAGCCDPASIQQCTIPTTCIASTAMSTLCTNDACSSDRAITKCTGSDAPNCFRWLIAYSKTTMTSFGCTNKGFTSSAQRSWQMLQSSIPPNLVTVTVVATPSGTPTRTPSSDGSQPSLGAIVGGTIGGCLFFSLIALVVFLVYRKRKNQEENAIPKRTTQFFPAGGMAEYDPDGFSSSYPTDDTKTWSPHGPVHRRDNAMPQYPGMGAGQYGIIEVDGMQRPVEAPADRDFYEVGTNK